MKYTCHLCGSDTEQLINLHQQPLANSLLDSPDAIDGYFYNAIWGWCESCQLLMLVDVPPANEVFNSSYPYRTSESRFMENHFHLTADYLMGAYLPLSVLEIGCNTGGILQYTPDEVKRMGFEPAKACWPDLESKRVPYLINTFSLEAAISLRDATGKFDLIFCANTLRSLKDLGSIFNGVKEIMSESGVFVIEDPYIVDIIDKNEFDQFYSENVYGFSITSMKAIADRFGMEVIDVDALPLNHGGSLRYHLANKGTRIVSLKVEARRLMNEEPLLYDKLKTFQSHIDDIAHDFHIELTALKHLGDTVVGYAATAKSVTILNYADIGPDLIKCIYDTTPTKWGKYLPGVHIPIVPASGFVNDDADVVILFAYNHAKEILERENVIKEREWLVYFPNVHYVESEYAQ